MAAYLFFRVIINNYFLPVNSIDDKAPEIPPATPPAIPAALSKPKFLSIIVVKTATAIEQSIIIK